MGWPFVWRGDYEKAVADHEMWQVIAARRQQDIAAAVAECEFWKARTQQAEAQRDLMVQEMLAFKRHEVGMAPAAQDLSAHDPMYSLGPQVQLAIDEFAAGDREMRKYLIGRAHLMQAAARGQSDDADDVDEAIAKAIRDGDR